MASEVLVKLPKVPTVSAVPKVATVSAVPKVPFPQGKKPPSDAVAQLEQNMKFLQEQHQTTLVALHEEVDSLRQRNRDLQFQLVFSKGSAFVPSSPSSPEDNETGFAKPKDSPGCMNVAPLQVELLEKDLQDIKISLQEAKTQNQYLSEIVEQQKKELDSSAEQKASKQSVTDVGIQVDCFRLNQTDEADLRCVESMVKQLMKQIIDQRKEIEKLKEVLENAASNKGARSRDSNNGHHNRGSPTSSTQEQMPHKFPPLQSQSYWHRRTPRNGRNRHDKQDHQSEVDFTVLPQLENMYRNYCRDKIDKIGRNYWLHTSQKDRRDTDNNHHHHQHQHHYHHNNHNNHHNHNNHNNHHDHRRDYKDRNPKDHQKEFVDSVEGSREADKSTASKS